MCGRFNEDLEFMVGRKPSIFWQVSWRFISPLIVLVILVFYLVTQAQEKLTYLVWDPKSVSTQAHESNLCSFIFGCISSDLSVSIHPFVAFFPNHRKIDKFMIYETFLW